MQRVYLYCLFLIVVAVSVSASEDQPCKSFEKKISGLQEECKSQLKAYAREKHGLDLWGLNKIRNSENEKDISLRKDLSHFVKNCSSLQAKKLKVQNQIDQNCFDKIISNKSPFD